MIYLINAEPTATERNTGMKTVDLSWDIFLKKNNLNKEYKRFSIRLEEQNIKVSNNLELKYNSYLDFDLKNLTDQDSIVFWGDFIHAHNYLKDGLFKLTRKSKKDIRKYLPSFFRKKEEFSFEKQNYFVEVCNFYLLKGIENKHWNKTLSFGTTLVGDSIFDIDDDYHEMLNNFVQNVDYIKTRDLYSALQIAHEKKEYKKSYLGVDAALLNSYDDYKSFLDIPTAKISNQKYIVAHFARTKISINESLEFANKFGKSLNMDLHWLPWLRSLNDKKYKNLNSNFRNSIRDICDEDYSNLIHNLKNASLVITDTYHLALIAWRLRVPVVCLGFGLQHPKSSLDDKKKEIFYTMYNMLPFYFYAEFINDKEKVSNYIKFIKNELLLDNKNIECIMDNIEEHSKSVEKDLFEYLINL